MKYVHKKRENEKILSKHSYHFRSDRFTRLPTQDEIVLKKNFHIKKNDYFFGIIFKQILKNNFRTILDNAIYFVGWFRILNFVYKRSDF
jgi:hypothetical protein